MSTSPGGLGSSPVGHRRSGEDFEWVRRLLERAIACMCPDWSPDRVEELAQKGVVRVFEVAGLERAEHPNAYLRRVAYNLVADQFRQERREAAFEASDGPIGEVRSHPDSGPEESLEARELGQALWTCLGRLTPDRRRALLFVFLGYKNREIAKRLDWNARKVENLVLRGRQDLSRCLKARGAIQ